MKIKTYYHFCNHEILDQQIIKDVMNLLIAIEIPITAGKSTLLRKTIQDQLIRKGWSSQIKLSNDSEISITAMNSNCALCIQTGNMSRFYADLLKLEYLHRRLNVITAIYIIPTKKSASLLGSNVASFERFTTELDMFKDIITIPMIVFGID